MTSSMRIVVTGLAITYPLGGVFWDYLQYALGFHRLGHDILYLEDTGKWCYDPTLHTFVESGEQNAELFAGWIRELDPVLSDRWHFRDGTGRTYGREWNQVEHYCRSADLFINISASCWMREEYFAAKRVAFIDSDPMYTQCSVPDYLTGNIEEKARTRIDMLRQHDVFFTFGENIGDPDCRMPQDLFHWIPTRQPIVLECFRQYRVPISRRRRTLTTVASWEPKEKGPVVSGVQYYGKSAEFKRFLELPSRISLPFELALSGKYPADLLRSHGWHLKNPYDVSHNPWVYRNYLATSFAEWSVAKNAYVASRSGWFSCRTAVYLALGVPAVVQDTGFGCAIPTGEGVIAFNTLDEAADAIQQIERDPEHHSLAAWEIAESHFNSDKVLSRLLDQAMSSDPSF